MTIMPRGSDPTVTVFPAPASGGSRLTGGYHAPMDQARPANPFFAPE